MNAAQAKKRKKELNEQMVSHMGHFKVSQVELSGSPKRKNYLLEVHRYGFLPMFR